MTERRKYRRFTLRYAVHGTFSSGNEVFDFDATSRNVSLGGLLIETASAIPLHSLLSFTMTVQGDMVVHPVCLAGEGAVVRLEPSEAGVGYAIAVACKQPIAQLESTLPV